MRDQVLVLAAVSGIRKERLNSLIAGAEPNPVEYNILDTLRRFG